MSQYQHYEFHAIDKPLDNEAMRAVNDMSSRVRLSPRKAVFTYSYSDFRYRVEDVLTDHFDFMFYIANWGTRRLMMKFPEEVVDYEKLIQYDTNEFDFFPIEIHVFKKRGFVILDINHSEEEESWWIEEIDYGYEFLDIRKNIIDGDYQALFLIWLRFLEEYYDSDEFDDNYSFDRSLIPPNLNKLNTFSDAVKGVYGVSDEWFDAILSYSENTSTIDFESLLQQLSKERMVEYLQMVLKDKPNIKANLVKELKKLGNISEPKQYTSYIKLIDIGKKASTIEAINAEQIRKENERKKKEEMQQIRQNEARIRKEIVDNVIKAKPKSYDLAVSQILELKAMYEYFDESSTFSDLLVYILNLYPRRTALKNRLKQKGIILP
jgi:hypothetical protein